MSLPVEPGASPPDAMILTAVSSEQSHSLISRPTVALPLLVVAAQPSAQPIWREAVTPMSEEARLPVYRSLLAIDACAVARMRAEHPRALPATEPAATRPTHAVHRRPVYLVQALLARNLL